MMKDIKGYEGLYAVTSCGKVWSYRKKIFLKPRINKSSYCQVCLYKDGENIKQPYVHRLVADAYLVKPDESYEVNHKDQNRENNCVNNLEWVSHKDNINYSDHNERMGKAHRKKVRCIETGIIYNSIKEAAESMGLTISALSHHLRGKTKSCGGYHWEYVEVN